MVQDTKKKKKTVDISKNKNKNKKKPTLWDIIPLQKERRPKVLRVVQYKIMRKKTRYSEVGSCALVGFI